MGKTGVIFFDAVGWNSGNRELSVTANEGVTLSGETYIQQLPDQCNWHHRYYVSFTLETADYLQIPFTGRRGFLDEIEVTETVTAINAPTLTDEQLSGQTPRRLPPLISRWCPQTAPRYITPPMAQTPR